MEALRIVSLAVGISLGVAALGTLLMSLGMDSLERLRQRWVTREQDAIKIVHA